MFDYKSPDFICPIIRMARGQPNEPIFGEHFALGFAHAAPVVMRQILGDCVDDAKTLKA
jgi:hypothetical protein